MRKDIIKQRKLHVIMWRVFLKDHGTVKFMSKTFPCAAAKN